jgi:putative membrane protein
VIGSTGQSVDSRRKESMNMMMALFKETFQPIGPGRDMDPWMWGWGHHIGFFSMIMMVLFLIAVIIAVIFLIRWLAASPGHRNHEARSGDSALEILKIRYAKGEINKEEFEEKKKDLG